MNFFTTLYRQVVRPLAIVGAGDALASLAASASTPEEVAAADAAQIILQQHTQSLLTDTAVGTLVGAAAPTAPATPSLTPAEQTAVALAPVIAAVASSPSASTVATAAATAASTQTPQDAANLHQAIGAAIADAPGILETLFPGAAGDIALVQSLLKGLTA